MSVNSTELFKKLSVSQPSVSISVKRGEITANDKQQELVEDQEVIYFFMDVPLIPRPVKDAKVIGLPRVGGLHHRYEWKEAAQREKLLCSLSDLLAMIPFQLILGINLGMVNTQVY